MKKILIIVTITLFASPSFSQYNDWYISLSMGGAWPVGDYSLSDPSLDGIGFAKTGFTLNVDATYAITPSFGVKGMFFFGTNLVNQAAVNTKLENKLFEFFDPSEINSEFLLFNVDYWLWGSVLFGPKYTIGFKKFYLDFHVMGGPNITDLPKQSLIYDDLDNDWFYNDQGTKRTDFSMAWLAGSDIRFAVSEKINLKLGVSYFYTKATLKTEQLKVNKEIGNDIEQLGSSTSKIPISTINATIGFVYMLD